MARRALASLLAAGALVVILAGASVAVYRLPEASPTPGAQPAHVAGAQNLILNKGCGVCHTIPGIVGATGQFAPSLAGVGLRSRIGGGAVEHRGAGDLQRWLLDPPALKPGTMMPKLGLTPSEAAAIADYLEMLR